MLTEADSEIAEIARKVSERRESAPRVSVKMVDGVAQLRIGKNSETEARLRLVEALGTCDREFLSPLLSQIGNSVSVKGEVQEGPLQFAIFLVKSIEPESEIEALLAAQMAAVHVYAMDASRCYLWSSSLAGKDSAGSALTKLTRTFTTQMEALKRHRSKAQQVVRVERVTVMKADGPLWAM